MRVLAVSPIWAGHYLGARQYARALRRSVCNEFRTTATGVPCCDRTVIRQARNLESIEVNRRTPGDSSSWLIADPVYGNALRSGLGGLASRFPSVLDRCPNLLRSRKAIEHDLLREGRRHSEVPCRGTRLPAGCPRRIPSPYRIVTCAAIGSPRAVPRTGTSAAPRRRSVRPWAACCSGSGWDRPARPNLFAAWRSSAASHARATFQSRMTVCGETRRASAVSSTLSPPKNRSSMTSARRGSFSASVFRASSRAQISAARSVPAAGSLSRFIEVV